MSQKKRLTRQQFEAAVQGLDAGERTRLIAHRVLVDGCAQVELAAELKITKGAVSQAVNRVWQAAQRLMPGGMQRITVTLPSHQVEIVKQWEKQAMQEKGSKR